MKHRASQFVLDEQGLETLEYAVMTALILLALVAAVSAMSLAMAGRFGEVQATVDALD